jgi:hypothetical protein
MLQDVYKPLDRTVMVGRLEKGKNVASITVLDENSNQSITVRVDRQQLIGILNSI